MSQNSKVDDLKSRIAEQAERLTNLPTADDNRRIRKRILQNLGKLKKQLEAAVESSDQSTPVGSDSTQSVAPLSNKKAKLKLKIINGEIAEYALKKQLKLARKRFDWLTRHSIKPGGHLLLPEKSFVV